MRLLIVLALLAVAGCADVSTPLPLTITTNQTANETINATTLITLPLQDPYLVRHYTFDNNAHEWTSHASPSPYVFWEDGSLMLLPNYLAYNGEQTSEAWIDHSEIIVRPGDTIIMEARVRSGPLNRPIRTKNKGVGIGADMRFLDDEWTQVYTMNGPASWDGDWATLTMSTTIPSRVGDISEMLWNSTAPKGYYQGGGNSYWNNSKVRAYIGKPMPPLRLTPWVHIWQQDSVRFGYVDEVSIRIIPRNTQR